MTTGVIPPDPASRSHVRKATTADVVAISEVAAATFALACPPDVAPEAVEAFVAEHLTPARFEQYLADPGRAVLVAVEDDTVIGYAMLVHGEPYDADVRAVVRHLPTTELSKIYVLPSSHGSGVARDLMAGAIDVARQIGAAGIWLGTNQANVRAHRFYEKSGFERVGAKRFLVGNRWEDDFVFELALD
jgi:GNAT superfamily N-acetyltransferase